MAAESKTDAIEAARVVRRGALALARRLRAERPQRGVSLLKLSVLAHLHRRGAMTPGDLAAAERLRPQSLSRTLAALERERLVVRASDRDDGRRATLRLTAAGERALAQDMKQRDAWLARAMAGALSDAERSLLRLAGELMSRLADSDQPPARAAAGGAERASPRATS